MGIRRLALVSVISLSLASAGTSVGAAQSDGVVGNGGFETPKQSAGYVTLAPGDTSMSPWVVGGAGVDHIDDAYWPGAEGRQSVDLNSTGPGSLLQDIATTSGKTYNLTFAMSANPGGQAVKTIDVYWDNQKQASFSFDSAAPHTGMGWKQKSIQVTATTTTTQLEFRSTSDGAAGPALDDVSLGAGGSQPPPPQSGIGASSFDPGLGSVVAIAFDHVASDLFIYPEFGAEILEYSTAGAQVGSGIPVPPPGTSSNDIDLDFATESLAVGGDSVPANELLVANGESTNELFAVDKNSGSVDARQPLPAGQVTGGAQHPGRDSFFILSWSEGQIKEIDPDTGALLNNFPVAPEGSPAFSTYYSDIDVDNETGNLVVVSDSQNVIRLLSPTGEWLGDADVFNDDDPNDDLHVQQMTGIGIDDSSHDVWISTRAGLVWKLTDLFDNFSTAVPCEQDPNALCGDDEDNEIQGTPENDTIYGGAGDDTIYGGGGTDMIIGGSGDDVLVGGGQKDRLNGGPGDDIISGDESAAPAASPAATAFLFLVRQATPPAADVLQGGGGNDMVAGGGGGDKVIGQAGNDDLEGNSGPDLLKGGGGVNDFDGGPGKDTCVLENKKDETQSCEKKQRSFQRSFAPGRYLRAHHLD